jgi:peptidoglycan/xylan/chitin deacetylase (PgdA/CDA1 family)
MLSHNSINTYRELASCYSWRSKIREVLRDTAVVLLALPRQIDTTSGWIRLPYYHHVFSDERKGFHRQVRYLKNYGDFISLDDAIDLLKSGDSINGRYFCITFDDGIRCCYDNAMPILLEEGIVVAFFIVTECTSENKKHICKPLHSGVSYNFEYLTWDECREMHRAGMIIGSHTASHAKLSGLADDQIRQEMLSSKQIIEQKLGCPCKHFACPWGRDGIDFKKGSAEKIARDVGYHSFLTTKRGPLFRGDSTFLINRDHILANWSNYQLRYFLSL